MRSDCIWGAHYEAPNWQNNISFVNRIIFRISGGGLAAVIYVDVVQVTVMILGSSLVLYRGLEEVGGWNALQEK